MTLAYRRQESSLLDNSILKLDYRIAEDCMIVVCAGKSDCRTCIDTIYEPIFNRLEDNDCTGLVIDKRQIECSGKKKGLDQVVQTILRYKNRSPLRKLALVTTVEYNKDEELLRDLLFSRGVNIRLFTDQDAALSWAQAYP